MFLLYHAYIYLELLILTCTIYILAPVDVMQVEETAPMLDLDAAAEKIISIDKYKAV